MKNTNIACLYNRYQPIKQAMRQNAPKPHISSPLPVNSVSAYLRLPNSHSLKLHLNPLLQLSQLQLIIVERFKIPQSSQIIYYKGRQLRPGKLISISDLAIFHIKDKRDMLQQISIDIILHQPQPRNFFKVNPSFTTLTVNQEETVGDFLKKCLSNKQQKLDMKRSRVIECGRFLRLEKTFKEMNIQQHAQIHIIIREKRGKDGLMEEQGNEEHEQLISRVLKHSRQNSIELPKEKEQDSKTKEELDGVLQTEDKIFQQESHICNFGEEDQIVEQGSIIENPSEIFGKSNPELDKSQIKSQSSLLLNHTKSSQKFIRQKPAKQQLTPLKLGLRKYKRYEGPLSVRACNCKKKPFQSQQHIKSSQSQHGSTLSPCLGSKSNKSHNKSQNKLKKSCALLN